jgi:hypothetical protein
MLPKRILPVVGVLFLLAGCSGLPATPAASEAPIQEEATQIQGGEPLPIESPSPAVSAPLEETQPPQINLPVVGVGEPYPSPVDDEEVGSGMETPTEQPAEDQTGGGVLTPGDITISSVAVRVEGGDPATVNLDVTGTLPTPCHQFAYTLGQPDAEGNINIEVYSLVDPTVICTQVLQPYEETVDLGSFPAGSYTILVNGEVIQQLDL